MKLAKSLQRHGRNGDSVLVHMQPREVAALQSLAKSQGDSLTINPETGLPEAFSLWKLLAGIGAAAAAPFTGGTSLAFLAPILGATGAALAASSFGNNKSAATDDSAARKYIEEQGKKNAAKYQIPLIQLQQLQQQPGYIPGVHPEQQIMPIRKPNGSIGLDGVYHPGFAEGGMIPEQEEAMQVAQALQQQFSTGEIDDATVNRFIEIFGMDALKEMASESAGAEQQQAQPQQQMAPGGLLKGPGGGMDDLIPARVRNGPQVALAGDEYIVPADATAMLGDGSSEAGGRKLDAFVQRIRVAKTGNPKQAPKINDSRMFPA
jgi:hypothetical protein